MHKLEFNIKQHSIIKISYCRSRTASTRYCSTSNPPAQPDPAQQVQQPTQQMQQQVQQLINIHWSISNQNTGRPTEDVEAHLL